MNRRPADKVIMLSPEEKAYCRGLKALREKDYAAANKEFDICGEQYHRSQGFKIIAEAARLLAHLRQEIKPSSTNEIEIKENNSHGKETIVCGQGLQEETG